MRKKIALVLARTLGDVVLVHNLVDGIYKKYDNPEIDVYTNALYEDIVSGNPKINRIFPSSDWLGNWSYILNLVASDEYDDVLIPQQLTVEDTIWHQLEYFRHQKLVDYYLERSRLPKRDKDEVLQLYVSEHDIEVVSRMLTINKQDNYVVIHTTSGVPTKDWDYFTELAYDIMDEGTLVIQVGGSKDKSINGKDAANRTTLLDLRGKLTFSQIGALCRKACCFVGLDSGLSYIAAATGIPTVVLQGSTVPETSGPWGDNVVNILSRTLPRCEHIRCHTNCKFPDKVPMGKCINYISVEEVLDAVRRFTNENKTVYQETKQ